MRAFTGLQYLEIDIANNFGLDKATWQERLDWVSDQPNLEMMGARAGSPVLFRKAVRAHRRARNGEAIGHPMSLDATASGLQIFAVLSGCEKTARAVNLIDTGKREDVYGRTGKKLSKETNGKFNRDDVKKPLMTHFYGSKAQPEDVFGENTRALHLFYQILGDELPGAMELMELIQKFWKPGALSHDWVMPDKHVVHARVMQSVDKKIEVDEFSHKTFTFRTSMNVGTKEGRSLAANIVHSIDAYVAREVIRRCNRKDVQVATIHDSFWAHPNDMQLVRQMYLEVLIEIARADMLNNILGQITESPGEVFFQKYSDDLGKKMRGAEYFLS